MKDRRKEWKILVNTLMGWVGFASQTCTGIGNVMELSFIKSTYRCRMGNRKTSYLMSWRIATTFFLLSNVLKAFLFYLFGWLSIL